MLKNKIFRFLCIFLPLSIVCFQFINGCNSVTLFISCTICLLLSVFDPIYGLCSRVLFGITASINENDYYLTIAVTLGIFLYSLIHNRKGKINFSKRWIALVLFIGGIFSFLVNSNRNISVYALFIMELLVFFIIKKQEPTSMKVREGFTTLSYTYIFGAIVYSVFSILTMNTMQSRLSSYGETTVRSLANMLGTAFLFCLFNFAYNKKQKLLYIFASVFFFIVLLMTGSRGVLYSVIIIAIFFSLKERLIKPKYIAAITIVIVIFLIFIERYMPLNINMYRIFEDDDGSRISIWKFLLASNEVKDWILGIGLNNAYSLYGWYAHSVFVDALISMGIVPFIALVIYIVSEIINNFKLKRDFSAFFYIAIVLLFLTHGSVFSLTFWMLIIVSDYLPKNNDKRMSIVYSRGG